MKDIGGLIWVIVVVIGVISSIVKNAKKAAAQREAARPQVMPRMPAAPPPPPSPPERVVFTAQTPEYIAPVAIVRQAPKRPVSAPIVRVVATPQDRSIRGMFGSGTLLVRAIVAAEVLGKPKSLQEQSIWSPRHSEPSI